MHDDKDRIIREQAKEIEVLTKTCNVLRSTHHSIKVRLDALKNYVLGHAYEYYKDGRGAKHSEALFAALGGIDEISAEFDARTKSLAALKILPKTGVFMLDILFELFQSICIEHDIEFTLNVRGDVSDMTSVISSEKLQELAANLLQNAIDAVNAKSRVDDSPNSLQEHLGIAVDDGFRLAKYSQSKLLVNIGVFGHSYMLSVWDSGIEFDVNTLQKIGKEPVTAKKDEVGGLGFMDIFNCVEQHKASFMIEEGCPYDVFTKTITIVFDEKGQRIIKTPRIEELGALSKSFTLQKK